MKPDSHGVCNEENGKIGIVEQLSAAQDRINKALGAAYSTGIAVGMLKDAAKFCINEDMKKNYLDREEHFQSEFEKIQKEAAYILDDIIAQVNK